MSVVKATTHSLTIAHQSHPRHYRDFLYVYPVISRRSHGLSIGINLNPDKVCNFDCVYCQVDRTVLPKVSLLVLATLERELREITELVQSGALAGEYPFNTAMDLATRIKDIAFSGDGEPTTVRQFDKVVERVVRVKQELGLQETKLVLITNGWGLNRREVQLGLKLMDEVDGEVWAKLDAGTAGYFRQVNRSKVDFDRILRNISQTASHRSIVIQSLFMRLHGQPPPPAEIKSYCDRLAEIVRSGGGIKQVQVYTVVRKPHEPWVEPLSNEELDRVAAVIHQATQLPVETFYGAKS